MNNDNSNFKINKYYLEKKKEKIQKLDEKNEEYRQDIKNLKEEIKIKKENLKNLENEYDNYKIKYCRFIEIFKERGITINIINKGYDLKEWDNLYLKKQGDIGVIISKDGNVLKSFDKDVTDVLEEIIEDEKFSIVITRVTPRLIKAQLHIR